MTVFRLSKEQYASDLSGKGAEMAGGRWNSKGTPVIYTSDSRALCTAEIAVHTPLGVLPSNYMLITLEVPDQMTFTLRRTQYPPDWNSLPYSDTTQLIGDKFIQEKKHLCLKVPSAVVPGDYNILINPRHESIRQVKILEIIPFTFDDRLFR